MGKRYLCDYCDKTMVATPTVIRTHNNGLSHQMLVQEHYQNFKDPEEILLEESKKKPCTKYFKGECRFGSICRYSHFTFEQMDELKKIVHQKNRNMTNITQPAFEDLYQELQSEKSKSNIEKENTVMYDQNGITHVFPWKYNNILDSYGDMLPPSIKRMKLEDFVEAEFSEWG